MQDDEFVVARRDDVLLQVIGTHGVGQGLGLQRVLGQVARGAAVSNDNRSHVYFNYVE